MHIFTTFLKLVISFLYKYSCHYNNNFYTKYNKLFIYYKTAISSNMHKSNIVSYKTSFRY